MFRDRTGPSGSDVSDPANWSRAALEEAGRDAGLTHEEAKNASRSFLVSEARRIEIERHPDEDFDFGGGL